MIRARPAAFAEFLEFQARLQGLLVFLRVIVDLAAFFALELDHVVLRHKFFGCVISTYRLTTVYPPAERLEPGTGIEPATHGLQNRCSTTELSRRPAIGGQAKPLHYR